MFLRSQPAAFVTRLAPEEVLERVRSATDLRRRDVTPWRRPWVVARIKDNRVRLWRGWAVFYNSFALLLDVRLQPWGEGSRMTGCFRLPHLARVATWLWLVLWLMLGGLVTWWLLTGMVDGGLWVILLSLLVGGLFGAMRWMATRDRAALAGWLADTVGAVPHGSDGHRRAVSR